MVTDVEVREAGDKGLGVYARRAFGVGEFIFRRRNTRVVAKRDVFELDERDRVHLCRLGVDRYALVGPPGCYMNHSCDPNAIRHGVKVFAWRSISAGEEITLDYRLNAIGGESWPCSCGAPTCTGVVAGGFFGMDEDRQRRLLMHAPDFIRREYLRRARRYAR